MHGEAWCMVVACKFAMVKREVGNHFTAEQISPTPSLELPSGMCAFPAWSGHRSEVVAQLPPHCIRPDLTDHTGANPSTRQATMIAWGLAKRAPDFTAIAIKGWAVWARTSVSVVTLTSRNLTITVALDRVKGSLLRHLRRPPCLSQESVGRFAMSAAGTSV